MNQNIIIGIVVALVLLGGGYFLVTGMNGGVHGEQATTTTSTTADNTNNTNTTEPTAPTASAPSVVTETNVAPTNSTAVLTGKVTPNGAPTTYWYEYGQSATFGSQTAAQTIGSGWTAIASPAYITGLQTDTLYYVRLSARNAYGTVSGITYSFSTNNNPPGQGTSPAASTDTAKKVTRTSATLQATINPHSSPTTYWFEYGTSSTFGSVTAFAKTGSTNASTAVSSEVSRLAPSTKYYFRVNAQNQYGTVNGATQMFTTGKK